MTSEEKRLVRNAQKRDLYHNWGRSEYHKRYYWEHCEECLARSKAYYMANREKMREYKRKYDVEHREELNAKRRERYRLNRDRMLAYSRQYVSEHSEKVRAYQKAYRDVPEHKAKMREYQRAYRERKKAEKLRKESELL